MGQVEGQPNTPSRHIPLSVPEIRGNEWLYIKECLDTNWVSSAGSFVDRFESQIAEYVQTKYAVATVNGTSALHLALLASGVEPNDEVIVSDLSFVAPANAIRYVGAWPVFMDSELLYWQMDTEKLDDFLKSGCTWKNGNLFNNITGRRVTAILPVHILGHPCDLDPILELAKKYNLVVIEDATESLGAKYKQQMVGSIGDVGCLSFNGNKLITTGGGGMLITNRRGWADHARYLSTQAKDDPVEYVHSHIGYNYRLTNIQAALGVAQVENIEEFIQRKRDIARRYESGFALLEDMTLMSRQLGSEPVYWLYTVLLPQHFSSDLRKIFVSRLNAKGIQCRPLWHPLHSLPPYKDCYAYKIENVFDIYNRAVSLPCSVGLDNADQDDCIEAFKDLYSEFQVC